MGQYEYAKTRDLAEAMTEHGIAQDVMDQILEGGESIRNSTSPERKAAWLGEAMRRMDALMDEGTRHAVRESCACCLRGKRQQITRKIAKTYGTIDERIAAANEARYVFGHSVTREDDGRIRVQFTPDGQEEYKCYCLPKANEPISITYCYCCGGHAKHHLQSALDVKLSCEVVASPLSTGGAKPCTFLFTIVDGGER